ncbi:MAG: hypothetical protein ABEJ97_06155 [Halobellus sp.]
MLDSDEWPDEPDEPDPEARWGAPEDDLTSVPTIDIPGEDAEDAAVEVDGDLAKFFWVTVIYANVAVAGVCVGLMLVVFRGQLTWGGGAVAVGLFALYRTYDLYRRYRAEIADAGPAGDDATDETGAREPGERNG